MLFASNEGFVVALFDCCADGVESDFPGLDIAASNSFTIFGSAGCPCHCTRPSFPTMNACGIPTVVNWNSQNKMCVFCIKFTIHAILAHELLFDFSTNITANCVVHFRSHLAHKVSGNTFVFICDSNKLHSFRTISMSQLRQMPLGCNKNKNNRQNNNSKQIIILTNLLWLLCREDTMLPE